MLKKWNYLLTLLLEVLDRVDLLGLSNLLDLCNLYVEGVDQ